MQRIEWIGDDCYCCGSRALTLHTEADQSLLDEPGVPSDWTFVCHDGDLVSCDDCGFHHHVSCDAETDAYLTWDECTEHNIDCWNREYE